MKVLITPAPDTAICFWCRGRKKNCITVEYSNGFLRNKPLCFECLERATRVQFASDDTAARKGGSNSEATKP